MFKKYKYIYKTIHIEKKNKETHINFIILYQLF